MNALITGATSAIAQQVARIFASRGAAMVIAGRNAAHLEAVRADLLTRGATKVECWVGALDDVTTHRALLADAEASVGPLDLVLVAQGALGDTSDYRVSGAAVANVLVTNAVAPASILTEAARAMEPRRAGCLVAIGSVAGDRGRASNYAYGAAKSALAAFLQGLRQRLTPAGVQVITVKPGFVDTPMTAGIRKNPLFASAESVAAGIVRAIDARRDVVYVPWFWRWVMLVVRIIPERVFKRLSM